MWSRSQTPNVPRVPTMLPPSCCSRSWPARRNFPGIPVIPAGEPHQRRRSGSVFDISNDEFFKRTSQSVVNVTAHGLAPFPPWSFQAPLRLCTRPLTFTSRVYESFSLTCQLDNLTVPASFEPLTLTVAYHSLDISISTTTITYYLNDRSTSISPRKSVHFVTLRLFY